MDNYDLFLKCVERIKRWPRIDASHFPKLPQRCGFVICAPNNGQYKLDVNNKIYLHSDYVKAKKAI